jgi:hypothetical protein
MDLKTELRYPNHRIVHPLAFEEEEMKGEYLDSTTRFIGNIPISIILYCFSLLVLCSQLYCNRADYYRHLRSNLAWYYRRFKRLIGIRR